jgi:hypothetical protein
MIRTTLDFPGPRVIPKNVGIVPRGPGTPFFPVKTHRFFFKNKKVISFLMNGFYA